MKKHFSINKINFKQVLMLFASSLILIILGFGIKKIQTNELGEVIYGEYAFFITLVSFLVLFFRFGFFVSIRNLLAQNSNPHRAKKLLGVGFIIAFLNGIALSLLLIGLSFFVNDLFNTSIGNILLQLSPLTIIFPFQFIIDAYSVGTNKIKVKVWYNILPKFLYLILLLFWVVNYEIGLKNALILNLIATSLIILFYLVKLRPIFFGLKKYWEMVWSKNKKYGFHYYKGAISNQTTYKLDGLFLSAFHSTTLLGFYSLALLITSPMIMLSQSISQAMFRRYANISKIPKEVFILNTIWLVACMIFFYFFSEYLVNLLFGANFIEVSKYTFYITFVLFFHGLSTPYSFLAAKSKGKEIKNIAYLEASFNIVGNLTLIPLYGIKGAIIASLLAKIANFLFSRYYYKKYLNSKML